MICVNVRKEDYFDDWVDDHESVFADAYSSARSDLGKALATISFSGNPNHREKRNDAYADFGRAIDQYVSDRFDKWWCDNEIKLRQDAIEQGRLEARGGH